LRDRNDLSHLSNGLSKYSRTSLQNHRQNTPTLRFMTISTFRWGGWAKPSPKSLQ